ncbi:MAG: efflux transporter periplasmic adaptor subunit, partial [Giesbergeria sp.]
MRWGLLLGLFVLAAALGGGAWWWNKQRGSDGAPTGSQASQSGRGARGGGFAGSATQPVSVGEVRREDVRVRVSAIGSMDARATAVVRARVSGELIELHFKEGDEVKA